MSFSFSLLNFKPFTFYHISDDIKRAFNCRSLWNGKIFAKENTRGRRRRCLILQVLYLSIIFRQLGRLLFGELAVFYSACWRNFVRQIVAVKKNPAVVAAGIVSKQHFGKQKCPPINIFSILTCSISCYYSISIFLHKHNHVVWHGFFYSDLAVSIGYKLVRYARRKIVDEPV